MMYLTPDMKNNLADTATVLAEFAGKIYELAEMDSMPEGLISEFEDKLAEHERGLGMIRRVMAENRVVLFGTRQQQRALARRIAKEERRRR